MLQYANWRTSHFRGGVMADETAGPSPITPGEAPLPDLAKLKRYFTESEQLTLEARKNSLISIDYYDSDQFTPAELTALNARGQPPIVINRIKPAINGIIGVTEKGRSDPRCWPRNPGETDQADAATDVLRYIADFNRFKRIKQDCFKDMLVPGTMAALVGVDADTQVTVTQIRWEEFFHDPRARRADFDDARYLGIAKWMYADDATSLYPEKGSDIEAAVQNGGIGGMVPDQSYQDRPLQGSGAGGAWVDPKMRRLLVIEMFYSENMLSLAARQRPEFAEALGGPRPWNPIAVMAEGGAPPGPAQPGAWLDPDLFKSMSEGEP